MYKGQVKKRAHLGLDGTVLCTLGLQLIDPSCDHRMLELATRSCEKVLQRHILGYCEKKVFSVRLEKEQVEG